MKYIKVRKRAKIRNRYNQVPHLTQIAIGKVTNSQLDITNESQMSALSQQVTSSFILSCYKMLRHTPIRLTGQCWSGTCCQSLFFIKFGYNRGWEATMYLFHYLGRCLQIVMSKTLMSDYKRTAELVCLKLFGSFSILLILRPCHTTTYSTNVCRRMKNSASTLVYAEYVRNKF